MQATPDSGASPSPGLQSLMSEGLRLDPAPKPCGAALLRTANPDYLIQCLIQHCTVDGYTSYPALSMAFEAALRELHAEARKYVDGGKPALQ